MHLPVRLSKVRWRLADISRAAAAASDCLRILYPCTSAVSAAATLLTGSRPSWGSRARGSWFRI